MGLEKSDRSDSAIYVTGKIACGCCGLMTTFDGTNQILCENCGHHLGWENAICDVVVQIGCFFDCTLCKKREIYTKNSIILHFKRCLGKLARVEQVNCILENFGSQEVIHAYNDLRDTKAFSWKSIVMKFGIFNLSNEFECGMCNKTSRGCTKSPVIRHLLTCPAMSRYSEELIELLESNGQSGSQYLKYFSPNKSRSIIDTSLYTFQDNLIGAKPIPRMYRVVNRDPECISDLARISLDKPVYKAANEEWVRVCLKYGIFYLDQVRFYCDNCGKKIYHDRKVIFRHLSICLYGSKRRVFLQLIERNFPGILNKFQIY
eukprot:NODE_14_length_51535_cov_1.125049.p21 type:complete len:318 gc:universal NODE_14_length_51535_cov_1.125049:49069-48116(-)